MRALAPGSARNGVVPPLGGLSTPHEQEADRLARSTATATGRSRAVQEPMHPLRASPWRSGLHQNLGAGDPLDRANRVHLERRLGFDLRDVRVHGGHAAQQASKYLGAQAWTLGTDIFLGTDAPSLHTPRGSQLLAHEIAHVLQQSHADPSQAGLSPAPYQVQRQPSPTPTTAAPPAAPTFSVNQATYLALVNQAVASMSAQFVQSQTLAATVEPILRAMLQNVIWKDAQGTAHGGGTTQHTLASGGTLNLKLILNDSATPPVAGEFTAHGATDGEMEIFIRKNPTDFDLAETLYHESMHLMSWLVNRPTPAIALTAGGRSGPAGAARTLDLAHSGTQIATVRQWLDVLAQSVNSRRATGAQISAANLDRMTRWLVEEVNVRIETEVFRLASIVQTFITTRGPQVIINPSANWTMDASTLDRYVFEFSHVFLPADRAGLTPADQQTLAMLLQILEGMFRSRVNRRFNPSPYLMRGVPRARPTIPLTPLTPPPFRPLPLP
jgi:hypothetical protein